jgi:hypothetical protein
MNRSRTNLSLIALALATGSFCFTLGAWADEALTKGMSLYQLKKYQEAIDSLRASKSQGDPLLHYYVANSLASLGKHKEAISEYQKCSQLDPDPETADYCAEALKHYGALGNNFAPSPAAGAPGLPSANKNMNTRLKESLAEQKEALAKAKAEAKTILDNAQSEAAKIQAEAKEEAAELPQYRHNGYWRAATTEQIKADAQERAKVITDKGKAEADAKIKAATEHAAAITSVAQELQSGGKGNGHVHLNGKNSNLYVRNYR